MPHAFAAIAPAPRWRLVNACAPSCLIRGADLALDRDGLARVDIAIDSTTIASILPAGLDSPFDADAPVLDLGGGLVWPGFVDAHVHLDKGQIWPRAANPDGTFMGALNTIAADREAHWSARDVETRMRFGLHCAYSHGTVALRTHLDSIGKQIDISWDVFARLRDEWRGRIDLQAACLFGIDSVRDPAHLPAIETVLRRHGGVLGCVAYKVPHLRDSLETVFRLASKLGVDLDFHVDESSDPASQALEEIADVALALNFQGRILCGHACSLALQPQPDIARVADKLARAGIAVVSLPMCNMYLQDRTPPDAAPHTPRWRGVAPLHELKATGVPVMVASDNTRDAFYAYGDLDPLEVFREATRILHLDHPVADWPRAVTATPADALRRPDLGRIAVGQPADLVLFSARSFTELLARPQPDRVVIRAGRAIDRTLPDYRTLDPLFARARP